MSLKPQIEAIIYAAETPITLDQIVSLLKDPEGTTDEADLKSQARAAIEELIADYSAETHGIELRQIAGGYRMSTKPEQHDLVRSFAKSLKPPIRLSLQALETLANLNLKGEFNEWHDGFTGEAQGCPDQRLLSVRGTSEPASLAARPAGVRPHPRRRGTGAVCMCFSAVTVCSVTSPMARRFGHVRSGHFRMNTARRVPRCWWMTKSSCKRTTTSTAF